MSYTMYVMHVFSCNMQAKNSLQNVFIYFGSVAVSFPKIFVKGSWKNKKLLRWSESIKSDNCGTRKLSGNLMEIFNIL
jgi:hypothetical protein